MKEYINELINDIEYKIEKIDIDEYQDRTHFISAPDEVNENEKRKIIICKEKIKILNKVKDYLIKLFEE